MITPQSSDITTADFEDSVEICLPAENKGLKGITKNSLEMDFFKVTEVKKLVVHEVFSKSCEIRNVTVFRDQAEVNRCININVKAGDVEVVMRELPYVVDRDSIRVTCSNEAAIIVEVAFKTKHILESNMDENEEKQKADDESEKISKRIVALKKEQFVLLEKMKRNNKELSLIESYANCISQKKGDKVGEILEKKNIESMLNFLSIYKDRSEKITDSNMLLNENLDLVNKEIDILTNNLNKIQPLPRNFKEENCLSILLDVKKDCTINLVVSYVVRSCASWTACYDVRAFSNDNTVQILYFANIQQSTGEDWNDCKISLSTALPSIGGSPPELQPQLLNIELPDKILKSLELGVTLSAPSGRASDIMPLSFMKKRNLKVDSLSELEESCLPTAEASEGMTSTSFEITRLATIPSDNNEHKVSICQLVFSPQFEYMAIPKSVAHAFLKLKVKNDSVYALLSGFANVFLDNNYLTKSCLPAVSPMEEFEIALGVDPAVKVTYKPLRKFQQTSGIISKFQVYDFHQQIEVKNTKRDSIKIKIIDQCPRSANDKIKVTLQEPDIKIPKSLSSSEPSVINYNNASLNTSDFKIEWLLEIASNETKIINLKYQVEHPIEVIVRGLNVN